MVGGSEQNGVDGLALRECGDVLFALWTKAADASRMRVLSDALAVAAQRNGGSIVVCQFIHPASKPPDASGRAEALKLLRRNEAALRRFITVPLGDQIWVGIVRSIMRGFFVLLRRSDILKIANDEASAIEKVLDSRSARTPPRSVLAETLHEVLAGAGIDAPAIRRTAS